MLASAKVAEISGVASSGYRVVVNSGKDGCETRQAPRARELGRRGLAAPHPCAMAVRDRARALAGQTVDHLHLHVIGGKPLTWPPGTGDAEGPKDR